MHKNNTIEEIQWFHTIELGNNITTNGISDNLNILKKIQLPDDLSGLSVLDIGARDGFFSFEAEKEMLKELLLLIYGMRNKV